MTQPSPVVQAERAVLTACLSEPESLLDVLDCLNPEDLSDPRHVEILKEITNLVAENRPVDQVLLTNSLRVSGKLEEAGGAEYVSSLLDDPFALADSITHIRHYSSVVKKESIRRTLIRLTKSWITALKTGEPEDTLDMIQADIMNSLHGEVKSAPVPIFELAKQVAKDVESKISGSFVSREVATGMKSLDGALCGGFTPGDLIILAARPSEGKSALALQWALSAALAGNPTLMFSIEMSREQNAQRVIASSTQMGLSAIRLGTVSEEEHKDISHTALSMEKAKLWIDDAGAITPLRIRTVGRRLQSRHGLKLLLVDYLQLLSGGTKFSNRVEEVSFISRYLKAVAKTLNVPVIALSQFSRDAARSGKPELHHLRESGSIEQDADVVMFLHRRNDDKTDLIIAKQRMGPLTTIPLRFDRKCVRFNET